MASGSSFSSCRYLGLRGGPRGGKQLLLLATAPGQESGPRGFCQLPLLVTVCDGIGGRARGVYFSRSNSSANKNLLVLLQLSFCAVKSKSLFRAVSWSHHISLVLRLLASLLP